MLGEDKNELDDALRDWNQSIILEPKRADVYVARAGILSGKKEIDNAIADYTEAIKLDARALVAFEKRASLWIEKKECDKAIADYGEAIKLDRGNVERYKDRARAWLAKGEPEEALGDCKKALRLGFMLWSDAESLRGWLWLEKKEYDKAIADFTLVINRRPKDTSASKLAAMPGTKRRISTRRSMTSTKRSRSIPTMPTRTSGAAIPGWR